MHARVLAARDASHRTASDHPLPTPCQCLSCLGRVVSQHTPASLLPPRPESSTRRPSSAPRRAAAAATDALLSLAHHSVVGGQAVLCIDRAIRVQLGHLWVVRVRRGGRCRGEGGALVVGRQQRRPTGRARRAPTRGFPGRQASRLGGQPPAACAAGQPCSAAGSPAGSSRRLTHQLLVQRAQRRGRGLWPRILHVRKALARMLHRLQQLAKPAGARASSGGGQAVSGSAGAAAMGRPSARSCSCRCPERRQHTAATAPGASSSAGGSSDCTHLAHTLSTFRWVTSGCMLRIMMRTSLRSGS